MSTSPDQIERDIDNHNERLERLERAVIALLKDTRSPHTGLMDQALEDILEELEEAQRREEP